MITVINNYNDASLMYEGTLSDAIADMLVESNQLVNDMYMSILLAEHAYLYENATEITYVDEAGNENENAVSIKDKIIATLKAFKETIAKWFNTLVKAIQDKVSEILQTLQAKGISKKDFEAMMKVKGDKEISITGWVFNAEDIEEKLRNVDFCSSDMGDGMASVYEERIPKFLKDKEVEEVIENVPVNVVAKSIYHVLYNTGDLIKSVKEARKAADKSIDDEIKRIKSSTDKKNEDAQARVKHCKDLINTNTKIMAQVSKAYGRLIANCAKAIKPAVSEYKREKFSADAQKLKNDVKAAPGKFANSVKEVPGKVRGAFAKNESSTFAASFGMYFDE